MKNLRALITLLLLLGITSLSLAQGTDKIDQLFAQKKRNGDWYKGVIKELKANQYRLEPAQILKYLDQLDSQYQPGLKSEEKQHSVLLKITILNKLGRYDQAIHTANSFISDLGKSAKREAYAGLWIELADLYFRKGNLDSATVFINISKDLVVEGSWDYYNWIMTKASELYARGNYTEAIKITQEAVRYYEKMGDDNSLAIAYNNLGDDYNSLNKPMEAVKYILMAADINKKIDNKHSLCMNYNNAGSLYSKANQLDKAITYYQLAYDLAVVLNDPMLMAQNIMNRGNVYEKKKDYAKAKQAFADCLAICEKHGIDFGKLLSFINLANVSILGKDYVQAELYLTQAERLTQKMGLPAEKAIVFDKWAKLYVAKGNYRAAYKMQEQYHALTDSLYSEKMQHSALELKEKFESEKKSNEINQLTQEKLSQQLLIALMGIGVLLLVVILQRLRLKQKLAEKEKQQDELQKSHLKAVLETKDKELTAQAAQLIKLQNDIKTSQVKLIKLIDAAGLADEQRKQIKAGLQKNQLNQSNADFDKRITETNADFYKILLKKYSDLTPSELKICAYLRLSISTKEIAQLTNRSVRTVETLRTDIRKKMKLSAKANLSNHLIALA